ncbi:MAG: universal stress protein [Deltaproteobacteria bacterium]|nr:universal stress protein [Deltaproteobacteria bacterium]
MITYKSILYCTDFSEEAEMACYHAADLAQRYQAKLYVLHVLHSGYRYMRNVVDEYLEKDEEGFVNQELIDRAKVDLQSRYGSLLKSCPDVTYDARPGHPFVEIVRYARKQNVDLIVLGATGRSELDRQEFGSTVENVARRAHCHVMAIRNPTAHFTLPG